MRLVFRAHALQRMFERNINVEDVEQVLASGTTIEEYPADYPLPSRLMLGFVATRPIHVVLADTDGDAGPIIITVYEPNTRDWEAGFTTRKT